jgi:hypothetical protein
MLNNNQLAHLGDLKGLGAFKKLKYLSLIDNPVTQVEHYRLFVIYLCPHLRMLDFTRIAQQVFPHSLILFPFKCLFYKFCVCM